MYKIRKEVIRFNLPKENDGMSDPILKSFRGTEALNCDVQVPSALLNIKNLTSMNL